MTTLNYNEVFTFMKGFKIDILNRFNELIIDNGSNTYTTLEGCEDMEDVIYRVVYSISRPIGKGLELKVSDRIRNNFNNYFKTNLTRDDFLLIYQELCYTSKEKEFKDFIKRGFPMEELRLKGR